MADRKCVILALRFCLDTIPQCNGTGFLGGFVYMQTHFLPVLFLDEAVLTVYAKYLAPDHIASLHPIQLASYTTWPALMLRWGHGVRSGCRIRQPKTHQNTTRQHTKDSRNSDQRLALEAHLSDAGYLVCWVRLRLRYPGSKKNDQPPPTGSPTQEHHHRPTGTISPVEAVWPSCQP